MLRRFLVTGFTLSVLLYTSVAEARRVALVIGNADYTYETKLSNSVNDAKLLARILEQDLKFDDVELIKDADMVTLNREVDKFAKKTTNAEVALIYFSGHGQQNLAKQNYLLATNAKIEQEVDLKSFAISSDDLATATEGAKIRLVVLDACRDRPTSANKTKSGTKGLSRSKDPSINGLLIAYATEDGKVAQDGRAGGNSPYAAALASELKKQDKPILAMFDEVMEAVSKQTGGTQIPTRSGNLTTKATLTPLITQSVIETPSNNMVSQDAELLYWESIKNSTNASDYAAYLADYPRGRFASLAKSRQKQYEVKPVQVAQIQTQEQARSYGVGQSFKDCADCPEMVVVPSGSFMMGSEADYRTKPVHKVNINYNFAVGKYEVTKGEYSKFVQETNHLTVADCDSTFSGGERPFSWKNTGFEQKDNHPVVCVSINDARAYIKWLNKKTNQSYRLLSESEWEYVAVVGNGNVDITNSNICKYGNVADISFHKKFIRRPEHQKYQVICDDGAVHTQQVGSYLPNNFGVFDLIGNVGEWIEDCSHFNYSSRFSKLKWVSKPNDGKPWLEDCDTIMVRGSSGFYGFAEQDFFRERGFMYSSYNVLVGFRVARDL